ncbi:putative ATP-dependent RNA helicase DHR1 [Coemansia thaxteri]|nr:putative ATP-dependent RNA helicase DHR1 [Coemansia thaxteri]
MGTNKSKKDKRFEKFVEKQVKKEERVVLLDKLSGSTWKSNLMRSSKMLGRVSESKREKLHRAALEEKLGVARSDPSVRLYVSERDADEVRRQAESMAAATQEEPASRKKKRRKPSKGKTSTLLAASASTAVESGHAASSDMDLDPNTAQSNSVSNEVSTSAVLATAAELLPAPGSLKRPLESRPPGSALASTVIVKRKRQKRGRILHKLGLGAAPVESSDEDEDEAESHPAASTLSSPDNPESDFDSSASDTESESDHEAGEAEAAACIAAPQQAPVSAPAELPEKTFYTGSMLKPLLSKRGLIKDSDSKRQAFYVPVDRPDSIQQQRAQLPVYAEEQQIMEAIASNPVVVLSGETGSGKTTQVPQFLFEAGYGDSSSPNPGMIGITQPRRVAAISMAHRVSEELGNFGSTVAHQVRFDTNVSDKTRVKFMTEGVLLRELASDLLLTRYSVVITDEAHERSLNTDILLGVLSRVVRLRQKLSIESPDKHRPLKLVIMSATLRVDDFVKNTRLFPEAPPVINVQSRQHSVRMHFNRRTPAPGQHIGEVVSKVSKIHNRLPDGGILVFLTGQAEITYVCKKLRELFPTVEERLAREQKEQELKRQARSGQQSQRRNGRTGARASSGTAPVAAAGVALAANGLEASVEDEDVDIGDYDMFTADGELQDDFMLESGSEQDSEEEEEIILGGGDQDEVALLLGENLKSAVAGTGVDSGHPAPLYVLPLYSLLSADQQLKVFAPPPPGSRLCVVATNVAETSITIPGIRYVVDTGLAKEKSYDAQTQVQSFEVGWTSQASANQRMGRAGRTGPGHCYRIFSSAVFNDQFVKFSEPEVLRMPIEGVVLQMKAMNLDNVTNFPFPTPPSRSALAKAERLLTWLGALDGKGRISDLGRLMSVFPVAPRFAKMLIVGQQHGCLPYVISIVAALSVGDPFVKEFALNADESDAATLANLGGLGLEDSLSLSEAKKLTSEEMAAKEQLRIKRRKYWSAQAKLAGSDPTSDILKWLTAVGAFEYAGGTDSACAECYVRPKAMGEIRKLRGQLTNLVQMYCLGVDIAMDPRMPPPTKLQQSVIRQVILAGFMDHVAVRGDVAGYHEPDEDSSAKKRGMHAIPYITMWSEEPVFVHPESVIYTSARGAGSMPQAIVFSELQRTSRLWAKAVTIVNTKWLATIGQPLCTFGNPLQYPLPKYNEARDQMTCYVEPSFGPKSWVLPMVKVDETRVGTRWQITKVIG